MSYILDALRRAESERERGGVPGLNAQPVPAGSLDLAGPRRSRAWIWVAIGITLGLAVPLSWRFLGSDDPGAAEQPGVRAPVSGNVLGQAPQAATAPLPAAPPPATALAETSPPPAPSTAIAPPVTPAQATATPPIKSPPRAIAPRPPVNTGRPATTTTARETDSHAALPTLPSLPAGPATPARQKAAPAPIAPATPLPRLAELPEDVRRDVPSLAFGGSIYSDLPAQRMVILNGQVLREGDLITGDLAVDEIRSKSAVLRIKGRRFELVF